MSVFGIRLKSVIESRGVTQRWVADKANTTEATISRYTSSKQEPPMAETLRLMAESLKVSADYLIGATNVETPSPSLPDDVLILIQAYGRASDADKSVLWALFDKYLSPLDKEALEKGLSGNYTI